jgi:hypothetical protein
MQIWDCIGWINNNRVQEFTVYASSFVLYTYRSKYALRLPIFSINKFDRVTDLYCIPQTLFEILRSKRLWKYPKYAIIHPL